MKPAAIENSKRLYSLLLRLYPVRFKQEFGAEMQFVFAETLQDAYRERRGRGLIALWTRTLLDASQSILVEHVEGEKGVLVDTLIKKTSAWLPLAMSLSALALLIGYVLLFGLASSSPNGDEGAPARVFQLLMAGQLPLIAFFALRWLPAQPRQAWKILALQIGAIVMSVALVAYLEM